MMAAVEGEESLEVKNLQPMRVEQSSSSSAAAAAAGAMLPPADEILQLAMVYWIVAKEHVLHYRKTSIAVFLAVVVMVLIMTLTTSKSQSPSVEHDYSNLGNVYDIKKAEIDHWCLGGGNDCLCPDPMDPNPGFGIAGWKQALKQNKNLVKEAGKKTLDVIFLGDETTEEWNGRWLGQHVPANEHISDFEGINKCWNRTFTKAGGGNFDGLALGISGDMISNLLWRLQNGEMPDTLNAKVWWILIGTNDLALGRCSEEAVILGILRLAEEIALKRPQAKVVIQSIMPRSTRHDGSLTSNSHHAAMFHKHTNLPLWPSIELVNQELNKFCDKHPRISYFDSSSLLLGQVTNEHYQSSEQHIVPELMPDFVHLSLKGHKVLAAAIVKKLNMLLSKN